MFNYLNPQNNKEFNAIKISIASPDQIKSWSYGEVTRPDTINYRTTKPESGGLFCSKIFGPSNDYECLCGKYKRIKYKGMVCEKCDVEVTASKVRRERMGHINLAAPVVHVWFLRSLPSKITDLFNCINIPGLQNKSPDMKPISMKNIEKALNYDSYIVTEIGTSNDVKYGELLSEEKYFKSKGKFNIKAGIGAEFIKEILQNLDLKSVQIDLRNLLCAYSMRKSNKKIEKKRIMRILKLVDSFLMSSSKPEWMILEILPVIPPDLRPLVMLDGGKFAASDLNELYRRVINRNNRLRRLVNLEAPDIIIRNEKRMLQESVDALFDNSRKNKIVKSTNKRPLKSLSDMLKGKYGRFRQNLLGKRVDYSGRSVIVVGADLKLHQCGLPKSMALELMKPFIYSKLDLYGISETIKFAKKIVEEEKSEVWDILDEVMTEHPVFLNRAPTLHRFGIQAFEPILTEGKVIQLHPLVCTAFNADFDGDQMAVHVPLSIEAQLESRILMMSVNNILGSANGEPTISPTQDIILGIYYLSLEFYEQKGQGMNFDHLNEVEHAIDAKKVLIHTKINFYIKANNFNNSKHPVIIHTTPGRLLLANLLPSDLYTGCKYINSTMTKKDISSLIGVVYKKYGQKKTVIFVDRLMALGFRYACKSGISIGKNDIIVPESKNFHIINSLNNIKEYENQYSDGLITSEEKYNKSIDEWSKCTDLITLDMMNRLFNISNVRNKYNTFKSLNSMYIMSDSGARGSSAQMRQLAGMRGLMTKPSGQIIETPIMSNFKEGLDELEYFISAHGARKGLADTALKTANSGYLTRKLVDVAQDCIITQDNCNTNNCILAGEGSENDEISTPLKDWVLGRVLSQNIKDPDNASVILIQKGKLINDSIMAIIEKLNMRSLKIKSVLTCESKNGVCSTCYGVDLARDQMVNLGEAVGIIAAQSIGEPGTQLTMRTFHVGGAAQKISSQSDIIAKYSGLIKYKNILIISNRDGHKINISKKCELRILSNKVEQFRCRIPYGARVFYENKANVITGAKIADWDPFIVPIITEVSGIASFRDLEAIEDKQDDLTGINKKVISRNSQSLNLRPRIVIEDFNNKTVKLRNNSNAIYSLPLHSSLCIRDKQKVKVGDILAKISKESSKSADITGGLPRVEELFEARKHDILISDIEGYITIEDLILKKKSKKSLIVSSSNNKNIMRYPIAKNQRIAVNNGDYVMKGDLLVGDNSSSCPHSILRVFGKEGLVNYMINEVQKVYKLQGVGINNKHIEVILKQMLKKVEIIDSGSTKLIVGEEVDKKILKEINKKAVKAKYTPAIYKDILQGITRSSLQTSSFLSAASFQETAKILTEASVHSKIDNLVGLKENVIVGRLIPAGTGFHLKKIKDKYSDI